MDGNQSQYSFANLFNLEERDSIEACERFEAVKHRQQSYLSFNRHIRGWLMTGNGTRLWLLYSVRTYRRGSLSLFQGS